jgi:hypothetical protein
VVDSDDYFGLAPGKIVDLKHAYVITINIIITIIIIITSTVIVTNIIVIITTNNSSSGWSTVMITSV